jgi:serine/threonine protein kinase
MPYLSRTSPSAGAMQTRHPPSPSSESWVSADSEDPEAAASSSQAQPDVLIGTTLLDTYKVKRMIAEGGMGRIYEAHHTRITEKRFAIKVLRPELVHSTQIRARFEREMQAVARVTHPGVLTIVDVGSTPQGWSFMVSEHLSGLDLLAYLRRFGALQSDRAVTMGCRIAEALEATHAQGVIHRDVKPSNVFLLGAFEPLGPEWDGVKLIDFGLSRFESRNDELSKSGMVMGTPAYMAPEQARGAKTDHLTDVYGVGAVLYAAATGVPPFREETAQQTLIAAMNRDPMRPRDVNPAISEALEVVIQRAMSKRPEERHPSMSALRLALSNLERNTRAAGHFRARGPAPESNTPNVRLRFLALGGSALSLAILGAASAVSGITALALEGLVPSASEAVLWTLTLGVTVGLLLLWLQRLGRSIWGNSAKLLDRLPRLRGPLIGGLVMYGLCSLFLRVGREVIPHFAESSRFDRWPDLAWPGWSVLLALAAACAAVGVAVHQRYWEPMTPRQRWIWGPIAAATSALLLLSFVRPEWLARSVSSLVPAGSLRGPSSSHDGVTATGELRAKSGSIPGVPHDAGAVRDAGSAHGGGSLPASPDHLDSGVVPIARSMRALDGERVAPVASASIPNVATAPNAPPASLSAPSSPAPSSDSASSPATGSSTLASVPSRPNAPAVSTAPAATGPSATPSSGSHDLPASPAPKTAIPLASLPARPADRFEMLRAHAIAQAERTPELADAVRTLEQLLKAAPERASDPIVRTILIKAAGSDGEASREAFRVMGDGMGTKGPDLLYDLMLDQPALAERAKHRLSRFKTRRHFSPQLSIAWDLRFSTSCGSRYSLLDRANELGDQRSVDTLSALLGKPEKCGPSRGLPCLPRCQKEAVGFTRSIEVITKRLRASEREAKAH